MAITTEDIVGQAAAPPKSSRTVKSCYSCGYPLCSVCNVCHTDGCIYTELTVTDAAGASKYRHFSAKTQKARGFVSLDKTGRLKVPQPYFLVLEESDIEPIVDAALGKTMYTLFVRPCPVRARHGFEESRAVRFNGGKSLQSRNDYAAARAAMIADVKKIFDAANAADEEHSAELILLPFVEAKYNAIITPSRMAIGPNHDGATAGYDSISIPLMGTQFLEDKNTGVVAAAGVGPDEDPYVEVVLGTMNNPLFTQIRSGVRVPAAIGADYLPAPMRVTEVIEAEGDLLEWEKQVKQIKPGTVVVKLGGTLISHYGVHCLYNKVPCFTSRRPEIGELLDVVSVSPVPNPEAVIKGLAVGALVPLNLKGSSYPEIGNQLPIDSALIAMMTTLHNAGAMSGEHGYWLGYSAAMMMRAGMAGSHGEARHKLQDLQNMRSYVYKLAFKDFMGARNTLGTAQWMFQNLKWSSSYGGPAWARCTQSIIDLDTAIINLLNTPSADNVSMVVSKLNNAVNQAHNGGWWLNKFIQHTWFDLAAGQSLKSLAVTGATMFRIKKIEFNPNESSKLLDDWKNSKPIEPAPGGKLHVQLNSKEIDQTIYNVSGPIKDLPKIVLNEVDLGVTLAEYTGAMCGLCLKKYDFYKSAEEISVSQVCGANAFGEICKGYVGWASEGTLTWKSHPLSVPDEDSSDDEYDSGDSDDDESSADVESDVPFEVPSGFYKNSAVESWPPVKVKEGAPKLSNLNGMKEPSGSITEAQCSFTYSKYQVVINLLHVQYKCSELGEGNYFSSSVGATKGLMEHITSEMKALILKGQAAPKVSWSGSGIANYWPLEVVTSEAVIIGKTVESIFTLKQPELNLVFKLNTKTGVISFV